MYVRVICIRLTCMSITFYASWRRINIYDIKKKNHYLILCDPADPTYMIIRAGQVHLYLLHQNTRREEINLNVRLQLECTFNGLDWIFYENLSTKTKQKNKKKKWEEEEETYALQVACDTSKERIKLKKKTRHKLQGTDFITCSVGNGAACTRGWG